MPLLEHAHLQEQLEDLPQGELLIKGCQFFARDLVTHLPDWIEENRDQISKQLDHLPHLTLTDHAKDDVMDNLRAFVYEEDVAYQPIWQGINLI